MENYNIQLKRTVKSGNSSAVVLPRAWLNQEVRIELVKKTPETILFETLSILKNKISLPLDRIIGVYLTGSYARNEQDRNSDIDVLVITKNIDKEMINEGIYNILIISSELLNQKLKKDLFPIGQMILEANALLNSDYLESIKPKVAVTKENISWYLKTTEEKINLISNILEKMKKTNKKHINDKVIYTLILRIRTLYIIKKIIENKPYLKKEFISLIKTLCKGENSYKIYLSVKNNLELKNSIALNEAELLNNYLKKQLNEVKKLINL